MNDRQIIRVAAFNVALNRPVRGQLQKELRRGDSRQAQRIAQIIQLVRPNVLALLELDWNGRDDALSALHDGYLMRSFSGTTPIEYPYRRQFPSNTGVRLPFDLNGDGKLALPEDAQGFGNHEGQYAFSILSQIPPAWDRMRSFQKLLWSSMPANLMPIADDETPSGIPRDAIDVLRLSSKNHVDLPLSDTNLHFIIAHPTPPVFDGEERRNALRNHDEIRLIADYVGAGPEHDRPTDYLIDDAGHHGGLPGDAAFVILGDMNADPFDGVSHAGAIWQLLRHRRVNESSAYGLHTPASRGALQNAKRKDPDLPEAREHGGSRRRRGNSSFHTTIWNLRVDYCLPSSDLTVRRTGVFWPAEDSQHAHLVTGTACSDHRLVWADIELG